MKNKDLPEILKPDDIAKDLDISVTNARRLFKVESFPCVKELLPGTMRIVKTNYINWKYYQDYTIELPTGWQGVPQMKTKKHQKTN